MGNSGSSSVAINVVAVAGATAVALCAWNFAASSWAKSEDIIARDREPEESAATAGQIYLHVLEETEDDQVLLDLSPDEIVEAVVDADDPIAGDPESGDIVAHGRKPEESAATAEQIYLHVLDQEMEVDQVVHDLSPDEIVEVVIAGDPAPDAGLHGLIKIMSYNVWNIKYVKLHERMKAISRLIKKHSPDIILLQEVTPLIYKIFQDCNWWGQYICSVPPEKATRKFFCMMLSKLPVKKFSCKNFENTTTGRGLYVARIKTGANKKLVVATCHLKKPTGTYSAERVSHAKEALSRLRFAPNAVLGGDMNWEESTDGAFPLLRRWKDAWLSLRPGEDGYTYDTESNGMLHHSRMLQRRLDRFVCKLKDFKMISIDIIGIEAIPGISYKSKGEKLPVLPSDHYGLILTICPK